MNIKRLSSIDSVKEWVQDCADKIAGKNLIANPDSYSLSYVNIGPLQEWGYPKDETYKDIWPLYSSAVQEERKPFDVYLVDGRFRVACALQALLHAHDNSLVLMHDFDREDYHVILTVAELIHKERLLAVLVRKPNVREEDLLLLYEEYKYRPDSGRSVSKVSSTEVASRPSLKPEGITRIPIR